MVDFVNLTQAVEYLVDIFPEIASNAKNQPSLKNLVDRLQADLWILYNAGSHAALKAKLLDDQWIAGRRAWLLLNKFSHSKRVFIKLKFHFMLKMSSLFVPYSIHGSSRTIPRFNVFTVSSATK